MKMKTLSSTRSEIKALSRTTNRFLLLVPNVGPFLVPGRAVYRGSTWNSFRRFYLEPDKKLFVESFVKVFPQTPCGRFYPEPSYRVISRTFPPSGC